jgi:hypothetical protein
VRDLGAGLALPLYQAALVHLMGGEAAVIQNVPVLCDGRQIGRESLPHIGRGAVFRLSALEDAGMAPFGEHLQRFLLHTPLETIHWININARSVVLTSLHRGERVLSR